MTAAQTSRTVPPKVYKMSFHERWRWARETSKLSHDTIVARMGRSNRSHLIKIEQGKHIPRVSLRNDYADATGVPRDLFNDEQEAALSGDPFRGSDAAVAPRRRRRGGRGADEAGAEVAA